MSLLLPGLLALLALCATWVDLVSAQQNATFMNGLLGVLDDYGCTNFTALVRQVTDDGQLLFAIELSDPRSPNTLFVPNNPAFLKPDVNFVGYDFQANDTQFLSALLLYHVAQGNWTEKDFNTSATIIPTLLSGNVGNMALFEGDSSQVISCGATHNGIEILDQSLSTSVVGTFQYEHLTVHLTDAVIGMPGNFSTTIQDLSGFSGLQTSAGYEIDSFDAIPGVTQFVPIDAAFQTLGTIKLVNAPPLALFDNHVITGRTIRSPDFLTTQYTSNSGLSYTFSQDPTSLRYSVTLNGVTANILRSDSFTRNGVIHFLDGVLYNTTNSTITASFVSGSPSVARSSSLSASASSPSSPSPSTLLPNGQGQPVPTPSASSSALGLGPIIGITVVGVSVLFCAIIGLLVWRVKRRAKMGWHIHRQARSARFDLAGGDREANHIDPFTRDPSLAVRKGEGDYASDFVQRGLSFASVGSRVPTPVHLYALQEKSQLTPPEPVAIQRGITDIQAQVPGVTSDQAGSDIRMQREMLPRKDWTLLQNLMQSFPPPADTPPDTEYGAPSVRPPTYYSTARSARSAARHQGL